MNMIHKLNRKYALARDYTYLNRYGKVLRAMCAAFHPFLPRDFLLLAQSLALDLLKRLAIQYLENMHI